MLKIGFGQEKITPSLPVFLSGYAKSRICNSINDDIFVKVIIIDFNGDKFAIVNYDLIAVDSLIINKIKEKYIDIKFVFCATHTHSSVAGIINTDEGILKGTDYIFGKTDFVLVDFLVNKTVDSINMANDDLKDGKVYFNKGVKKIAGNRNNQSLSGYDDLSVWIFIQDNYNKVIMVNYACHPTILNHSNNLLSGDFPNVINQNLVNNGFKFCLFANGCAGDISTRFTRKESGFEEVNRIGNLLSEEILRLVSKSDLLEIKNLELKELEYNIKIKEKDPIELAEKKYEKYKLDLDKAKAKSLDNKKIRTFESFLEGAKFNLLYSKNGLEISEYTINITLVRYNDNYIMCIPGEIFSELANLIKQDNIYFIGYANGYVGYFANEYAYDHNFYEAMSSPFKKGEGEKLIRFIKEEIDGYSR